ncbi:hypothetical protein SVAN01_11917 [Stagonosporopsis vannaccii]|nr:hypothetical protein SVAN01_11917 [Stagonosporopsis vannaccii]
MCLYQYLYFTTCQHGELTLITYCGKAKALDIPEQDSLSRRSLRTGTDYQVAKSLSPLPPTSSSASTRNATHLHSPPDQHCNMTTFPPFKASSTPGFASVTDNAIQHSNHGATRAPRSAFPEPGVLDNTPQLTSLTAMRALEAFTSHNADGTLALSRKDSHHVSPRTAIATCRPVDDTWNSDVDAAGHGTSESSIDIITERGSISRKDGKAASQRTPSPARRLSSPTSPMFSTAQADKPGGQSKAQSGDNSTDHERLRAPRSSYDMEETTTVKATFLTKEALDAVDANTISPKLRRSPTQKRQSPTKQPWNSLTMSPKMGSLRRSTGSPTKPSTPPRTALLGSHIVSEHRRAPSSVVSTGATTFHTAHGSPVRSTVCSQSSYSSAEDCADHAHHAHPDLPDEPADIGGKQIDELHSDRSNTNTPGSSMKVRARPSKPQLSISIPSRDSASGVRKTPVSALVSPTSSSSGASPGSDRLDVSSASCPAMQSSRIPRISPGKGSTVRAPTLSSMLKQTKSAQTLRPSEASKRTADPSPMPDNKVSPTNAPRHVRTLDNTGSTPVILDRGTRSCSISASRLAVRTPSRATSTSTVKAIQNGRGPSPKGNMHASDADDEHDDSAAPASISAKDTPSLPLRGRSAPNLHRDAASDMSSHSTSTSHLRPTAEEFVPAQNITSMNQEGASGKLPLVLPDLYSLDGYGIPWYYHMYPVPCLFPPIFAKGRSNSPRKPRPRNRRSTPGDHPPDQGHVLSTSSFEPVESPAAVATAPQLENAASDKLTHDRKIFGTVTGAATMPAATNFVEPCVGSFASQFDEVAHQATRQPGTKKNRPPQDDLTTIRNVATREQITSQGYHTLPSRRRTQHTGNGLYGGRGSVGVPLHATAPFPTPVAPMGRPADRHGGYNIGTGACGNFDIAKAFEHGGRQACNTCEPDH